MPWINSTWCADILALKYKLEDLSNLLNVISILTTCKHQTRVLYHCSRKIRRLPEGSQSLWRTKCAPEKSQNYCAENNRQRPSRQNYQSQKHQYKMDLSFYSFLAVSKQKLNTRCWQSWIWLQLVQVTEPTRERACVLAATFQWHHTWGCVVRVSKILSRRSSDPNLSRMTIWKEVIFFSSFIKTMVGPLLIRNTSYTHIVRCEVQHCEKKKNCWDPPSVGCYTCDACKGTWLFSSPALLLSALFIKGKMWSASTYFDSITLRANFSWATQQHSDQRAFEREGTISNPTQIQIFKGTPYTIETAILIHTACIYL